MNNIVNLSNIVSIDNLNTDIKQSCPFYKLSIILMNKIIKDINVNIYVLYDESNMTYLNDYVTFSIKKLKIILNILKNKKNLNADCVTTIRNHIEELRNEYCGILYKSIMSYKCDVNDILCLI